MPNTQPIEVKFDPRTQKLVGSDKKPVNLEFIAEKTIERWDSWEELYQAATEMGADAFYFERTGAHIGSEWAYQGWSPLAAPSYLDTSSETVPTLEETVRVVGYKLIE
jgi:hypothetical protein